MPTHVAGLPVVTEPPPPGVIVLRPEGPDPQPTLNQCPAGYTELQKYRWRFCNSVAAPQPIPTGLMIPPIAGVPYIQAEEIFKRQNFMELPGVQSVSLGADGIVVKTAAPALLPSTFESLPVRTEGSAAGCPLSCQPYPGHPPVALEKWAGDSGGWRSRSWDLGWVRVVWGRALAGDGGA